MQPEGWTASVRKACRSLVEEEWPEEMCFFDALWDALEQLAKPWLGTPSETWPIQREAWTPPGALELAGLQAVDTGTVRVGMTMLAALSDFVRLPAEQQTESNADAILQGAGELFGLAQQLHTRLREHFLPLCVLVSAVGRAGLPVQEEAPFAGLGLEGVQPAVSKKRTHVQFTDRTIVVDGVSVQKVEPLLLAEYLILKDHAVHWLWAFVFLPHFEAKDPKRQFMNYISKWKRRLASWGIRIARKTRPDDDFVEVESTEDRVMSNIRDVRQAYDTTREQYGLGRTQEAMTTLSSIATQEYSWFTFTDAYMTLASWIRQAGFEGISDSVARRCESFLNRYARILRSSLSRIEAYRKNNELDPESLRQFEAIKRESDDAERLAMAFAGRVPIPEEEAYENLVRLLLDARQRLLFVEEDGEALDTRERAWVAIVNDMEQQNAEIAAIMNHARDVLMERIQPRGKDGQMDLLEIADRSEVLYYLMAEVTAETERLDDIAGQGSQKLSTLRTHLQSSLLRKLKASG